MPQRQAQAEALQMRTSRPQEVRAPKETQAEEEQEEKLRQKK
jgi:hypothetical protein